MRTFNGLQIFTEQLTNSGQLDLRYVRVTGDQNIENLKTFTDGLILSKDPSISLPASSDPVASPIGYVGQMIFSTPHIYICTEANGGLYTWKRVMIQNF